MNDLQLALTWVKRLWEIGDFGVSCASAMQEDGELRKLLDMANHPNDLPLVIFRWASSVPPDQKDDPFIQGMLDRMGFGYHNYGHMRRKHDRPDNIKNVLIRLVKYVGFNRVRNALAELYVSSQVDLRSDGNTEFLMDAANFCMMEFAVPSHPQAHFTPTTRAQSPGSHVSNRIVKGKDELMPGGIPDRRRREGD